MNHSYDIRDDIEAAPTPIVHAGPRRGHSPVRHNVTAPISPIYDPNAIGRRNSTKSSKGQYARKGRPGTLGAVSTKSRDELRGLHDSLENLPPMPTYFPPPPQNENSASHRPSLGSSADLAPPSKDRPGFFRRVFGSKNPSPQPSESENSTPRDGMTMSPTQESFHKDPSPAKLHKPSPKDYNCNTSSAPKEQSITKKSSAFFRRRKKSISEQMPGPLPLSLQVAKTEAAEHSPVSSLRQVMDPYLNDPPLPSPKFESRTDSPQGFQTANTSLSQRNDSSSAREETAHRSSSHSEQPSTKLPIPESKYNPNLKVPQQDHQDGTFLADSSGGEDSHSRSRQNYSSRGSDGRPRVSPSSSSQGKPSHSEGALPVRFPFASTNSSRVTTPTTGSRSPHSPVSPTMPKPPVSSKSSRPSNLRLQQDSDRSIHANPVDDGAAHYSRHSPLPTGSDLSVYKSAPSTPYALQHDKDAPTEVNSPTINITASPESARERVISEDDQEQALKIFENRDENLDPGEVSAWLGDAGEARERVRVAYMKLFDWTKVNILSALRGLCARIALKGETQQVDRMLDAFSKRWCECNSNHGFKSTDVVHTVCYSILLLNTDLHLADIGQKMTRTQFIRNTLPTIRRIAADSSTEGFATVRAGTWPKPDHHANENHSSLPRSPTLPVESQPARSSIDEAIPVIGSRSTEKALRDGSGESYHSPNDPGPLVTAPFIGSIRAWESQIENVLKTIYSSIARERLPLFGAAAETVEPPSTNLLSITGNMLRRSPSTLSKAASEHSRGRGGEHRLGTGRWVSKTRSRPQLYPVSTHGSTRTSMDEGSSAWSPSISSTWSKASAGKTLTSMSVDSFGSENRRGDYQKSIGFANALSQAIIREDSAGIFSSGDEGMKVAPLLDDESLELSGAPWAKEGSLKHKHHLDGVEKRAKGRNWSDCFAVIEKGWMRLFSFSVNAKSMRVKAKDRAKVGGVVGGGNWMDNAEEVWKFLLRQTIASALPDPGYSKARPYVWALSLPTGAVHLFQVGTPDIVKEFVSTANYWSARLSKEPMMGGISNMEYGWSDTVINRALIASESHPNMPPNGGSRPSKPSSLRSSIDHNGGTMRPKMPGDKVNINDWSPPQQSMMASQLMEVDQLRTLQAYVKNVEDELAKHNELRPAMQLAFSMRHPNTNKAMANWEKKSSYLLREIVKFKTYVDILLLAQKDKGRILRMKAEDKEREKENQKAREKDED
jgi:Sec7 domain/Pleckstrin homology domain